jgi:hypothetical protein
MPWMRRLAFVGLTLFVAFPLAATGAIGGSILGTLLGLSRLATFLATVIGCLIGNLAIYTAADQIQKSGIFKNPFVKWAGVALLVGLIILMEVRYRRQRNKHAAAHR